VTPEDAERLGVAHRDVVEVALDTPGRDLVFGDVVVRVSPAYALEMHVDTDEGNAAEIEAQTSGVLVPTERTVKLKRRRPPAARRPR
jgi:propanediol utilization protein